MLDNIISLDNGCDYAILDQVEADNRKFYFAVKVDKEEKPLDEYEIFEEIKDGEDTYMDILENDDLKKALVIAFTDNHLEAVTELLEDN